MKFVGVMFLLAMTSGSFGQIVNQNQVVRTIDRIFTNYISQQESTDSNQNKKQMELSLKALQDNCDARCLSKLLDVWMYYDPTDFPTRELVKPILLLDKLETLKAIEKRIKKRNSWESADTEPYAELFSLKDEFQ